MAVRNLSDERLLKRASHAGRNLAVLTTLATLGALVLWSLLFLMRGAPPWLALPALAVSLMAAGYWSLSIAGYRGNPASVGVTIVAMVLQLVLVFLFGGIAAARAHTEFSANVSGLIIPILVLIALASSRSVLLELQKRGLWEQAFPGAKPSGMLCVVGGILLGIGLVTLNGAQIYAGFRVGQERAAEARAAKEFLQIVKQDEGELMKLAGGVLTQGSQAQVELALNKADALATKVASLQSEARSCNGLASILQTYSNAVRQWKNGLLALKGPTPDKQKAQQLLALGDRLREDAAREFARRFAAPKQRSPS